MRPESLLAAGGLLSVAAVVFHLFFWKIFRWREDLAKLTRTNRAIMQILNLCLMVAFVLFAYVSLVHPDELLNPGLGRSVVILIAVFWYARAVEQVVFFGLREPLSLAFFLLFLAGGTLYAVPLLL